MDLLNNSKIMVGLSTLVLNVASKHVFGQTSPFQTEIFNHPLMKQFIIFLVIFSATRDFALSAGLALLVTVIFYTFIHPSSTLYLFGNIKHILDNKEEGSSGVGDPELQQHEGDRPRGQCTGSFLRCNQGAHPSSGVHGSNEHKYEH